MKLKLIMSLLFIVYGVLVIINMFKIFSLNNREGSKEQLEEYALLVKRLYRRNILYCVFLVLLAFVFYLTTFG